MLQTTTSYLLSMCRSVDALRRLVILIVLAALALAPALRAGVPGAKRSFDIAAGDAATTLRQFVEQSGEQVFYLVPKVQGVKTNPVKGQFIAREVIERMLKNTPLVVLQDARSGAMTITRDRRGNTDTAAPPSSNTLMGSPVSGPPDTTMKTNTTMKKMSPLAVLRVFLGLAAAAPIAGAVDGGTTTGTITGRVQNVATGRYLNNARISIKGTNHSIYTDRFGVFRLVDVPSGPVVVEVFYTDLDLAQVSLVVPSGGTVDQEVKLSSVARYGATADAVKLDAFVVAANRETDARAIAINEQRFAPNIKNVQSADSLGSILGDSVGEFLRFMPGITAEHDNSDIGSISLRGIGGSRTAITVDGAPASNLFVSATRTVDLRSMSLNDVSRFEVTKVPTPAMAADSLAGAVNMVSKSAFERNGRQLRFSSSLTTTNDRAQLGKAPISYGDRKAWGILPGASFELTLPVGRTFGVVIAGLHANTLGEQHGTFNLWANTGSGVNGTSASNSNPLLSTYLLSDGLRHITRNSLSIRADWKLRAHSVLSLGHTMNRTTSELASFLVTLGTGTNGTPTIADGGALTWDASSTRGATGRGSIDKSAQFQRIDQLTDTTILRYRYDDGRWKIESGLSRSASAMRRRFADAGFFSAPSTVNNRPIRVNFLGIRNYEAPATIEVFDNNNQPFEWRSLNNFRATTANSLESLNPKKGNRSGVLDGHVNVQRRLPFFSFPASVQAGVAHRVQMLDMAPQSFTWTFMGPDGNSGATAPLDPYVMQVYRNQDSGYGFKNIDWISPERTWQAFQKNPLLYSQTPAQQFAGENFRIDNSEYIKETVRAAHVQAEASLLGSRLRVLGGVRFETTTDRGQGAFTDADAVWQRDAAGNFVRNAAGARVRKPEAGTVNSLEQLRLTRRERGANAQRAYDGYYPSLHLTYSAREDLLVRVAYARTYGRPDFTDIIPRVVADTIADDNIDPSLIRGRITIRNPSLNPWTADNYDLSVEYYSKDGGVLSAGVFVKEINDFFGDSSRIATPELLNELNFDQRYVGWNIISKFNAGSARIRGGEFNLRQSLRPLGSWGGNFTLFANGTRLLLDGSPGASFTSFIPRSGNWGATFARKRVTTTVRWNYRGLDRRTPRAEFGPDGYEYLQARRTVDVSAAYQLWRHFSFNATANNLGNAPLVNLRYGSRTPDYARQFRAFKMGVQLSAGISGTF